MTAGQYLVEIYNDKEYYGREQNPQTYKDAGIITLADIT